MSKNKKEETTLSMNFLADKREDRFRKGLWQFFIDHARLLPDGNFEIIIFAKSEQDLWRRAEARMSGRYKVTSEEKLKQKGSVTELHSLKRERDRIKKASQVINQENKLFGKVVLWAHYKLRGYLMSLGK